MDLTKITLERQTLNNKAKIRAENKKAELALEHLHAKMASAQAKQDTATAYKAKHIKDKKDEFEKRKQHSAFFGSNMVSFTISSKIKNNL